MLHILEARLQTVTTSLDQFFSLRESAPPRSFTEQVIAGTFHSFGVDPHVNVLKDRY